LESTCECGIELLGSISHGVSKGKRPLVRPRCRWRNNITMDFKEIGVNTRDCVDSAQDRDYWRAFLNATLNLWIP
jgi:hypothetical protein